MLTQSNSVTSLGSPSFPHDYQAPTVLSMLHAAVPFLSACIAASAMHVGVICRQSAFRSSQPPTSALDQHEISLTRLESDASLLHGNESEYQHLRLESLSDVREEDT